MPTFFHHKLRVYQATLQFIVAIDAVVALWPPERRYLVYQMRRAASSIGLNIAEAAYEISADEKRRFFRYARRSAGECVGALDQAIELKIMSQVEAAPFYEQLDAIIAMLTGLTRQKTLTARSTCAPGTACFRCQTGIRGYASHVTRHAVALPRKGGRLTTETNGALLFGSPVQDRRGPATVRGPTRVGVARSICHWT